MASPGGTAPRPWRARTRAAGYLAVEGWYWLPSLLLALAALVVLPFALLGVALAAVPRVTGALDRLTGAALARAGRFRGTAVPPRRPSGAAPRTLDDLLRLLAAPATKRALAWLGLHALLALAVAVVAIGAPLNVVLFGTAAALAWSYPGVTVELLPFTYVPPTVDPWQLASLAVVLGMVYGAVAWWGVPWLARRVASGTAALLGPTRTAQLSERVEALSASRAAALDAHGAELSRIERELHDGAQNQLVGVVMMLGLAKRALENDPAAALPFVERAQDVATRALAELRDVVHDIYPPVLAELGLGGAASALTSRSPVPCTLDVAGLRRAPAAVESAAYFVLAEALTNAAKYAAASRIDVALRTEPHHGEDVLVVEVVDDGRGGARLDGTGTGLAGMARRAAAFEGALHLSSPPGGPTRVRVELPCGS
ncbi:sensor histidine kinase [Georgenia faecalis]|uniref:sensor histidine kinase n=1 Tax=Georgenia faecalis TaxID=2483799 RepID=UPI000FDBC30A|nr:histidine kinase [Georgenia faecalis]